MPKRPDTAARARRLLALLPLLRQGESVSITDLAAAIGSEPAEVAADLSTLTMCGVPPFTPYDMIDLDIDGDMVIVYGDAPGIDRPLRLTPAEAQALASALDAAGYDPEAPLLHKLRAAASTSVSPDELARTVRASAGPGGIAETYSALAAAAEGHQKARITYFTGATGSVSTRTVHPWALVNRYGVWYLVAFCETVAEERVFRLDRVLEAIVLEERFTPPSRIPMEVTPDAEGLPIATLRLAPGTEVPDTHAWPGATFDHLEDGSTIISVPYQSESWIVRRVMSFLGDAEVLAPPELRDAVRQAASDAIRSLG